MTVSINYNTFVISVEQADLTFVSGTLYALDTETFRETLKDLEDDAEGMPFGDTHRHNTTVTIAGVTYARSIEILSPYTVEFEDGQYAVRLDNSNNNIFDEGILVRNQVSVIPTNSAGLQVVTSGSGLTTAQSDQLEDLHQFRGLDSSNALSITDDAQTVAGKTVNVTDDGTTTSVTRS